MVQSSPTTDRPSLLLYSTQGRLQSNPFLGIGSGFGLGAEFIYSRVNLSHPKLHMILRHELQQVIRLELIGVFARGLRR